jgi:hypothetical protein
MTNTANLRTAKQWAEHLGISERQMHKVGEVMRYRPDLMDKVAAKEMSVHAAWLEATGRDKDTSWDRLVRAWLNATYEDRCRFLKEVAGWTEEPPAICLPDGTANLQNGAGIEQ